MRTSLKWIKDLVPGLDCTPQEYMDAMTMSGSKVEFFENQNADLDKIVIAKVEKIERHPDADKLVICQVNIGSETTQIVTGAQNVFEGAVVPAVLDGGKVAGGHDGSKTPGGIKIKKGKLRGVESNGMMCSIEELGSDRNMFPDAPEDGLYIMPSDAPVGEDAVKYLGLNDTVVEYEITSNRVDCFSILGLAREAAATFNLPFNPPVVKETGNDDDDVNKYISVEIKDTDLCPRYTARVVKNIKIEPSPKWMQERLRAQGIRPINNIVDITNYVMEEFGQPMHAYDLDTIAGNKIIVKRASDGEKFITLDGQERILDSSILTICDGEKAIGLAGIMGGENSMITDNVSTMLFEAATFDGTNIRLSGKKVGMRTDASAKFEKGLDPNNAICAINRACQLIEELGCGEVVGGVVDIYPNKKEAIKLPFEPEYYNKLLGTDISVDTMKDYFKRLELEIIDDKEVLIPTFRQDLLCRADLAEEVARIYGYDKIPTSLPSGEATTGSISFKQRIEASARNVAEYNGFSQAYVFSFESPKVFDKLLLDADDARRNAIVISNPLGEDFSIMRTLSLNGMLTSLATNFNRRNKDVRLYEMANIYIPKALPLTELPDERMQLTLGMYGEGDFYSLKGVVEEYLSVIGMTKKLTYSTENKENFLHPGRQAKIVYDGTEIGYIGEVHPTVAGNYNIKERVYVAVLDIPSIIDFASYDRKYTGVAKFPAVTRDISILMGKDVTCADIENVFEKKGGAYLESYELFDVYQGERITAGFKSMAFTLTFRAPDKTLDDDTIGEAMNRIIKTLDGMGITLRM